MGNCNYLTLLMIISSFLLIPSSTLYFCGVARGFRGFYILRGVTRVFRGFYILFAVFVGFMVERSWKSFVGFNQDD